MKLIQSENAELLQKWAQIISKILTILAVLIVIIGIVGSIAIGRLGGWPVVLLLFGSLVAGGLIMVISCVLKALLSCIAEMTQNTYEMSQMIKSQEENKNRRA